MSFAMISAFQKLKFRQWLAEILILKNVIQVEEAKERQKIFAQAKNTSVLKTVGVHSQEILK